MPARLCYSPKVYAFAKNNAGTILDISPYIVSGEVQRNINQVSSATVVLRNPNRLFTTPPVPFHAQDPITIYMERLTGYPVRVFTGYLDDAPYFQLQPGVVQLQASCTLKRLLYSYFDPSLPYMLSFLEQYGWVPTSSGTIVSKSTITAETLKDSSLNLEDGSISRLLWGILYDIGDWDDTDIWIEPLPTGSNGIVRRILTLMAIFDDLESEAAQQIESVFNGILGTSGQGSSNGATINTTLTGKTNAQKCFNFLVNNGLTDIGAAGVCGNWWQESSFNPTDNQGGSTGGYNNSGYGYGIAQWSPPTSLIAWCQGQGLNYEDLSAQLQYAWSTMPESLITALNSATSPGNAATVYEKQYEKAGTPDLSNRIQYANQIYQEYATGVNSGSSGTTPSTGYSIPGKVSEYGNSTQSGATNSIGGSISTVYDVIVEAANALASSGLPYDYGGGHSNLSVTSEVGYDCSGSVSYVLYSAGLITATGGFDTSSEEGVLKSIGAQPGLGPSGSNTVVIWVNPGVHTFMRIGGTSGRYWGTTDGSHGLGTVGACGQWLSQGNAAPPPANAQPNSGFQPYYLPASILTKTATYQGPLPIGADTIPATGASGTGGSDAASLASETISKSSAEAFVQSLSYPTGQSTVAAIALGTEGLGLMQDQSLLPFVQQVAQASMRNFMSLPDGSFYAFYPDYFGEMGQHYPYWMIDDIEITNGTIYCSDDGLATHVFATGDNSLLGILNSGSDNTELFNDLYSTGTITIFNAFESGVVQDGSGTVTLESGADSTGLGAVMSNAEALEFIKRYGARPYVQDYPMIRSSIFEMLMAYQLFMQAWSNQFLSTFHFTFMPEIFPGGKVGFPQHGLMMYVNQVTHTFDYTEGFTTDAQLSSPSLLPGANAADYGLPPNMVAALVEPVKASTKSSTNSTSNQTYKLPTPSKGQVGGHPVSG